MSSVAYLVTRRVKHLATWTQDAVSGADFYATGQHRPVCGAALTHRRDGKDTTRLVWPNFPHEDQSLVAEAAKRPICRACRRTVGALFKQLIEGEPS